MQRKAVLLAFRTCVAAAGAVTGRTLRRREPVCTVQLSDGGNSGEHWWRCSTAHSAVEAGGPAL